AGGGEGAGLGGVREPRGRAREGGRRGSPPPPLYESGVRYQREVGTENWTDVARTLELGYGDCEDLACWRVAELRLQGHTVGPYIRFRRVNGVYHFHALVMHYEPIEQADEEGDDEGVLVASDAGRRFRPVRIEDPSLRLGMGWEQEFARLQGRGQGG